MTDGQRPGVTVRDERNEAPERDTAATRSAVTRRGVLAVAGATLAAGCGGLGGFGGGTTELDSSALDDLGADGPAVRRPFPVEIADAHLEGARERVESALASAPLPFDTDEIPNGAMRAELTECAESARERLAEADAADAPRDRLEALADARESARVVAGAWAAIEGDLAPAVVHRASTDLRTEINETREEWEYVGDDPVRALFAHDAAEELLGVADGQADVPPAAEWPATTAYRVGEAAGEVAYARAHLADARHLGGQFRDSLATERSLRDTFEGAHTALTETVEARLNDLPATDDVDGATDLVDADIEDGSAAARALRRLQWWLPDREAIGARHADLADGVLDRHEWLAGLDGFAVLRDRIESGERFTVGSVTDLRERRAAAVEAVETALAESENRLLARGACARPAAAIESTDRDLARQSGEVPVRFLRSEIGEYAAAAAVAEAVPDACSETLAALDG